ncbi:UDP-glycosyltransferase 74F2-like [Eucalyptus grandis]|uniref:UDP-glycosyltransferase 74F2-like n=1 Tax=Eucalyptus grandis TaxID=71139 RepID=UPI00192EB06A|nr:UDP-glycosyltransferase 74F2-like [Eucalyptus grandis]
MEPSSKLHRAHVLVLPFPGQGHINPMLQFSKRLVSKGLKATLALTVHVAKSMHAHPSSSITLETISDGHDLGGLAEAESIQAYLTCFQAVGSRGLAELIHKLDCCSGRPVDAIIYDGFLPWVLDVAKQREKVGVVFFTQTCAVNNIYYHVQRGLLPLPLSGDIVKVPGLPPLEPPETPSFVCKLGTYPASYDLVINQFINVDEADFVLCDTFYELEKEVYLHSYAAAFSSS